MPNSNNVDSDVFQLIYVSRAKSYLDIADIREIERTAIEKNNGLSVTGVLIHCHGKFMQVLEGKESDVKQVYSLIEMDNRHSDLEILKNQKVPQRQFTEWEMKYIPINEVHNRQGELYEKLFDLSVSSNEAFECAMDSLGLFLEFKSSCGTVN